ncbi:NUDIX domain-containing protein [Burkholderia cenocepacia]|nr:NUDIX domain-containing protein [Burkholderia cenocepacia]
MASAGRSLPDGVIRRGESTLDAAHRELWEDTGLVNLALAYFFHVDGNVKRHHVFATRMPPGRHACPGREIALCRGVGLDAVARWPASTPTQRIIRQLATLRAPQDATPLPAITRRTTADWRTEPRTASGSAIRARDLARTPSSLRATASAHPTTLRRAATGTHRARRARHAHARPASTRRCDAARRRPRTPPC